MTSTNDTFFDQIISAKAALDAQPRLEAEIARLRSELEASDKAIQSLNIDLDTKATVTNDLHQRITELEAGLNESRKSEADTGARLSLLVDTLRDVTGNIGVALNVIEPPKPEPVATVAEGVSVSTDPTMTAAVQSAEAPTSSAFATDWRVERDAVITTTVWPTINPEAHPANSDEARLRSEGKGWFDTHNHYHLGSEASAAPSVPFAPSTASQSDNAESPAPTTSAQSPAEPSDGASLNDILRHAYTRS